MKRIIRGLMLPFWWATGPLRRALMSRYDARVVRLVSWTIEVRLVPPILEAIRASDDRLERIEALIERADRSASTMAEEVNLVLSGLSREIFRLRAQIATLRGDDREAVGGLTLLSDSGEDGPIDRPETALSERSRVG